MQKKMPLRSQLLNSDSMSADGSNAQLYEDLMSDVSAEDEKAIRVLAAERMRKEGMPEFVIEVMLGQPTVVPKKT